MCNWLLYNKLNIHSRKDKMKCIIFTSKQKLNMECSSFWKDSDISLLCATKLQSLKEYLWQILRYKLLKFWITIGPKLSIWPKEDFLVNFAAVICIIYCAVSCCKVWKNYFEGSWDINFSNFETPLTQNCSFGPKEDLLENLIEMIFFNTLTHNLPYIILDMIGPKKHWPKRRIFVKFLFSNFHLFVVPHHAAQFA